MKKASACVILSVTLSSLLLASPSDHSYSLKRLPKAGDSLVYRVQANFQFGERTASMTMDQTEKITKVDPAGTFDVETSAQDCHFVVDGKTRELKSNDPATACYDTSGCLVSLGSEPSDSFFQRKANMLAFIAPDKPVSIGADWDRDWTPNADGKTVAAKSTFHLEGEEKVDGIKSVRVAFTYTESTGDYPLSCSGHEWVNEADGSIVKIDAKFKNLPMGATGTPVDGTIVMERKSH